MVTVDGPAAILDNDKHLYVKSQRSFDKNFCR